MIEFKHIEIKYGDFVAIRDLNLTIGDGEFFTFLGPSGCGKTTTLRALVGFLEPSAGQILIDGKTNVNYMGKISLEKPLSRNLNIVEGE